MNRAIACASLCALAFGDAPSPSSRSAPSPSFLAEQNRSGENISSRTNAGKGLDRKPIVCMWWAPWTWLSCFHDLLSMIFGWPAYPTYPTYPGYLTPPFNPPYPPQYFETKDKCPNLEKGTPPSDSDEPPNETTYEAALKELNISSVKQSIVDILTQSKECWPADDGHYGPFFVRLAWHCAGTFRKTDRRGGCHGGRIRFEPERSWGDNTHLDKARALLYPVKEKFGDGLSWGDLIIAAGTVSMDAMGFPRKRPLCFGRKDDSNGGKSNVLIKNDENLGPSAPGLIYVEPDGPEGYRGNLTEVAAQVKKTFSNMGAETKAAVALIGGGHAFGKAHGACQNDAVPGPSPKEAFAKNQAPWLNVCPGGGVVTSGFEGYWTKTPNKWSNDFFKNLRDKEWKRFEGPGGQYQWQIKDATPDETQLMMLSADLVLWEDSDLRKISETFADDITELEKAFDDAWYTLTTNRDGRNEWANAAKCDTGDFPADLRKLSAMLDTDNSQ